MDKEERGRKKPVQGRAVRRSGTRLPRRTKRPTKKEDAEKQIAASTSLAYLSKADIRRHIHEGLRPYQHLADQAGLHFLSYLIALAVDESGTEGERAGGADEEAKTPE